MQQPQSGPTHGSPAGRVVANSSIGVEADPVIISTFPGSLTFKAGELHFVKYEMRIAMPAIAIRMTINPPIIKNFMKPLKNFCSPVFFVSNFCSFSFWVPVSISSSFDWFSASKCRSFPRRLSNKKRPLSEVVSSDSGPTISFFNLQK